MPITPAHAAGPPASRTSRSAHPSLVSLGAQRATARSTWKGPMWPSGSGAKDMAPIPLTYWASPSVLSDTRSTLARSNLVPSWATASRQNSPGATPTHPSLTGSTRDTRPPSDPTLPA